MAELATEFAGLRLRNPVIVGSSEFTMTEAGIRACVDAGAGAVVAKSINERPEAARQLALAEYVLLDAQLEPRSWDRPQGSETLLNRSGLPGVDIDEWVALLERAQTHAAEHGSMVIGSVTVAEARAAARLAARMAEVLPAIELNLGAPHGREAAAVRQLTDPAAVGEYVNAVRQAVDVPLLVKLPALGDVTAMASAALEHGAGAVVMIGRLNGFMPSLHTRGPELGTAGAVGGHWMMPVSLYWVSHTHRTIPGAEIVATNGARSGHDVARFMLAGARAVELVSLILMRGPHMISDILEQLEEYLDGAGIGSAREIVGIASDRAMTYADLPDRPAGRLPWAKPDAR